MTLTVKDILPGDDELQAELAAEQARAATPSPITADTTGLPGDTLISIGGRTGFKRIDELKEGDVIDGLSQPRVVQLITFREQVGELLHLVSEDGHKLIAPPGHEVMGAIGPLRFENTGTMPCCIQARMARPCFQNANNKTAQSFVGKLYRLMIEADDWFLANEAGFAMRHQAPEN